MSEGGLALARAAEALIGTPFRLHGRDPCTGLDCAGLLHATLLACGHPGLPPFAYGLRNSDIAAGIAALRHAGLREVEGRPLPCDVLLVQAGPAQVHLLIAATGNRFVHAHAGLRRVVATPAPLPWPILRHWRLATS